MALHSVGGRRIGVRSSLTVEPLHDGVDGGEGQGGEDGLSIHTLIKNIVCEGKEAVFRSGNLLATFSDLYRIFCCSQNEYAEKAWKYCKQQKPWWSPGNVLFVNTHKQGRL